jgi:hypothetical protein
MLTFHEAEHRYFWDGKPVPNVTSILAPLNDLSMVPANTLERARMEGVAMHKTVELEVRGDLDVETLPDWLVPRLAAWRKFVADTGFTCLESEFRVFHPTYQYAGTLDLFGTFRKGDGAAFIDLKRSFAAGPVIGLQLAAYHEAYCAQQKVGRNADRYALRLDDTGSYRLEPFPNKSDFGVFLALLTVQRFKEKL